MCIQSLLSRLRSWEKKQEVTEKFKWALGSHRSNKAHSFTQAYTAHTHLPTTVLAATSLHMWPIVCTLPVAVYGEKSTEIAIVHLETLYQLDTVILYLWDLIRIGIKIWPYSLHSIVLDISFASN